MKTLKYSAGAVLSSAAMVVGFAAPVGAVPAPPHVNHHHNTTTTTTTNIDSNNTLTFTKTVTNTTTNTTTDTNTFTNSGIVQTQLPSGMGGNDHHDNGGGGTQTAVQGTKSGVYHVDISQSQSTTQSNETNNMTLGQANFSGSENNASGSHDQTNTQTNSNTQTLSQSNTTTQTMSVNQSAQGVVVN